MVQFTWSGWSVAREFYGCHLRRRITMKKYRIVDRGDGPKIEGTRITVYAVFEYLEMQRSREWIAALLGLSSRQVQAAIDYIDEHRAEALADYQKIADRIRQGNPPWVQERLREAREKFQARKARRQAGVAVHVQDHGGP
jgi:uncharacterized protein (DUF433 family)